jgi:septal ring factor EnvC (AmiA/AmiB activator)|nr:MAG TPA: outer capsid protein sigma-1 attachment protein [Caudoviricetes sp.]
MTINNYDGFLKYKQDNGDIAVLYPKTTVANVEGAATAASVTDLTGRVDTIETNVTTNTAAIEGHGTRLDTLEANQGSADTNISNLTADVTQAKKDIAANSAAITKEVSDREAADTALDTRVKTLESGAHNPPQLYVSDTEPETLKARDWWFDTSAT